MWFEECLHENFTKKPNSAKKARERPNRSIKSRKKPKFVCGVAILLSQTHLKYTNLTKKFLQNRNYVFLGLVMEFISDAFLALYSW